MDDELDGRSDCESDRGGDEEDEDEGGPEAADDVVVEGHRSAGRGTLKLERPFSDTVTLTSCISATRTDLFGDLREEERVRDVVEDAVRRQHDHVTVLHGELVPEEE